MSGKPVLAASANESVLFPAPASPVTTTRHPMADGAARMAVSIAHVPAPWSHISGEVNGGEAPLWRVAQIHRPQLWSGRW